MGEIKKMSEYLICSWTADMEDRECRAPELLKRIADLEAEHRETLTHLQEVSANHVDAERRAAERLCALQTAEKRIVELERELYEVSLGKAQALEAWGVFEARIEGLERVRDDANKRIAELKAVLHRINDGGHFLGVLVQQDIDTLLREEK
jgi:chromosome segregation ATPase